MQKIKNILATSLLVFALSSLLTPVSGSDGILKVPDNYSSIQEAIDSARAGDTILLAPGVYKENIIIDRKIVLASNFLMDGSSSSVEETIIDGQAERAIGIMSPKDELPSIIGLTIRNADDGILAISPFHIQNCIVTACEDGIDYETGSGGTCMNNLFFENLDDGIDLDGTLMSIRIENNVIRDNDDDGIEIRLHTYQGDLATCHILNNRIYGNLEDGIQFIDYADTSSRVYYLEDNLIYHNSMAGIAFMDQGDTKEDYRAAEVPEPVILVNNTISHHQYALCGGGNVLALNNVFINTEVSGIKGLGGKSVLSHCLLFEHPLDFLDCSVEGEEVILQDPGLDEAFRPESGSVCIDAGTSLYIHEGDTLFHAAAGSFHGEAPDLGAIEFFEGLGTAPGRTGGGLSIFPNPCHNFIRFSLYDYPEHGIDHISLLDGCGRVIFERPYIENNEGIDLSSYPSGIYFLRLGRDEGIIQGIIKI